MELLGIATLFLLVLGRVSLLLLIILLLLADTNKASVGAGPTKGDEDIGGLLGLKVYEYFIIRQQSEKFFANTIEYDPHWPTKRKNCR